MDLPCVRVISAKRGQQCLRRHEVLKGDGGDEIKACLEGEEREEGSGMWQLPFDLRISLIEISRISKRDSQIPSTGRPRWMSVRDEDLSQSSTP